MLWIFHKLLWYCVGINPAALSMSPIGRTAWRFKQKVQRLTRILKHVLDLSSCCEAAEQNFKHVINAAVTAVFISHHCPPWRWWNMHCPLSCHYCNVMPEERSDWAAALWCVFWANFPNQHDSAPPSRSSPCLRLPLSCRNKAWTYWNWRVFDQIRLVEHGLEIIIPNAAFRWGVLSTEDERWPNLISAPCQMKPHFSQF